MAGPATTASETPHVAADVFAERDDQTVLLGSRCRRCGALAFPSRESCANPTCLGGPVEPADLQGPGTVHTFTVQHYAPPAPFDLVEAPYAIVGVDLDVPLRVIGLLDGDPESVRIGQRVRLTTLATGREGAEALTWAFAPEEGADHA